VVVGFAVRGFLRGTVAQVFLVVGLLLGLGAAGWVSQWLAEHWQGARPFPLFLVMRWLVAGLAGMAVASLFQWWGERLGDVVRSSPVGWLDRVGGLAMGVIVSALVLAFVVMGLLLLQHPRVLGDSVARTRLAAPLMHGAARACTYGDRYVPGSRWLRQRFMTAEQRARDFHPAEA
jgi:uncharacterized membrane protein required for colicin V production